MSHLFLTQLTSVLSGAIKLDLKQLPEQPHNPAYEEALGLAPKQCVWLESFRLDLEAKLIEQSTSVQESASEKRRLQDHMRLVQGLILAGLSEAFSDHEFSAENYRITADGSLFIAIDFPALMEDALAS